MVGIAEIVRLATEKYPFGQVQRTSANRRERNIYPNLRRVKKTLEEEGGSLKVSKEEESSH